MPANGETATIPVITKVTIEVSKSLLAKRKMADGDGKILELLTLLPFCTYYVMTCVYYCYLQ